FVDPRSGGQIVAPGVSPGWSCAFSIRAPAGATENVHLSPLPGLLSVAVRTPGLRLGLRSAAATRLLMPVLGSFQARA
ncbi:MAG TPA: hypothetical protein VFB82_06180, partial [Blastocatellia bacterium]|nr:hypothetical protein [Blastocatellia bacterium]